MKPSERLFLTLLLLFAAALRFSEIAHGQPDPLFAPTTTALRLIHEKHAGPAG